MVRGLRKLSERFSAAGRVCLLGGHFFAIVLLHAAAARADYEPPPPDQPQCCDIKIGAILPLTGDAGSWGEAIKNGIELARTRLPEKLSGRVQVLYEDDQRNPRLSVNAFKKLTEIDHVQAVIGVTAQPGLAVSPLAEQARIPYISIAVPKKISIGKQYTVLLYATAERMAELMADEAKRRGYRRIARVSSIHDGRFAMRDAFDHAAKDISVVLDEEYPIESRDFRPFLNKLRSLGKLDAIYINLVLGQAGVAARQARELGISLPLFESEMFEDDAEVALSGGALVGQWFVNEADAGTEFLADFRRRYPKSKVFNAANGFDAFTMLVLGAGEDPTPEGINRYLHRPEGHTGIMGRYLLDAENRFQLPVAVKEVRKDGFVTLRTIPGAP